MKNDQATKSPSHQITKSPTVNGVAKSVKYLRSVGRGESDDHGGLTHLQPPDPTERAPPGEERGPL